MMAEGVFQGGKTPLRGEGGEGGSVDVIHRFFGPQAEHIKIAATFFTSFLQIPGYQLMYYILSSRKRQVAAF